MSIVGISSDYLVSYCIAQVGRPYWPGGCGHKASKSVYDDVALRIKGIAPWSMYSQDVGQKVHDCNGLLKAACWTVGPDSFFTGGKQYKSNGCGDWGVDTIFEKCSEKGTINNMPETPGIILFTGELSHMAVYIGNGELVEARGTGKGVQRNKLKDRSSFTLWGKLTCCINYITVKVKTRPFETEVKTFQRWINTNYGEQIKKCKDIRKLLEEDGGCGPLTKKAAVIAIQIELNKLGEALKVDGGFGPLTSAAMSRHMLEKGDRGNLVYILQGLLYGHGYDPEGFDGSFGVNGGTGCLNALKNYQTDNNLEVDGKAGGESFASLVR